MTQEFITAFLKGYSDSSFTNPHEAMLIDEPEDRRGTFTHMGAQYWGYETRRHRATCLNAEAECFSFDNDAYHWLNIGFTREATVSKVTFSTRWYTGNQVPEISLVMLHQGKETMVLDRVTLDPDSELTLEFEPTYADGAMLKCYHEGGLARVNFYGDMDLSASAERPNLLQSATISHVSNEHFGGPRWAVEGCRKEDHMRGWESARWGFGEQAVFSLSKPVQPRQLVVDTYLHRLNSPLSCHAFGWNQSTSELTIDQAMALAPRWQLEFEDGSVRQPENFQDYMRNKQFLLETVSNNSRFTVRLLQQTGSPWVDLIGFVPLRSDTYHEIPMVNTTTISHLLYLHYPNGGIHGLKLLD
ncbi:MAG: allantoicase [Oceanicoccus sp.]|jgi:allantoicase